MSNTYVIVGKALRAELAKNTGTNELLAKLTHYAGKARVLIVQHGHKMETDAAYREAWERLIKVLSEKNGSIGSNAHLADAIQAFLTKAL